MRCCAASGLVSRAPQRRPRSRHHRVALISRKQLATKQATKICLDEWLKRKFYPPPAIRSAWLRIKQGKISISKRGDGYVRTLLIHGARVVLSRARDKGPSCEQISLPRPRNVAAIALADKMARTAWTLLMHDSTSQNDYAATSPA